VCERVFVMPVCCADPDSNRKDLQRTWVNKSSSRIWRGSYANNDWQVGWGHEAAVGLA
jgi:hypothetical protein